MENTLINSVNGNTYFSIFNKKNIMVEGIITLILKRGFVIQDNSDYKQGSNGIFIKINNLSNRNDLGLFEINSDLFILKPGYKVKLLGKVSYNKFNDGIRSNNIKNIYYIKIINKINKNINYISIGKNNNFLPNTNKIDDDTLNNFNIKKSALDFFKSLEFMLVKIDFPTIVGKNFKFNNYSILLDTESQTLLSYYNEAIYNPTTKNPDVILLSSEFLDQTNWNPGDRFDYIIGIIMYKFGRFTIVPRNNKDIGKIKKSFVSIELEKSILNKTLPSYHKREYLNRINNYFSIMTLNLFNFNLNTNQKRLAEFTVGRLGAPEIILFQEMPDDTFEQDRRGITTSKFNLKYLLLIFKEIINDINSTKKITVSGTESVDIQDNFIDRNYKFINFDPLMNQSGGKPGLNIRNVIMYCSNAFESIEEGLIGINKNNINLFRGSRNPIYAKLKNKKTDTVYTIINVHHKSKRGDDNIWGSNRPLKNITDSIRIMQNKIIKKWINENTDNKNIIIGGDFNDYEHSKSMEIFDNNRKDRFMKNLVYYLNPNQRYTKFFKGVYACLDHMVVSKNLFNKIKKDLKFKISDTNILQYWIKSLGEEKLIDHNVPILQIPVNL